jgi:hypothetical protein
MAAARKKRKPSSTGKEKQRAQPQAGLEALDSGWRSFIKTSALDLPLTEAWKDPKGAPSTKTVIRSATVKKALKKTTKKKTAKKKAKKSPAPKK